MSEEQYEEFLSDLRRLRAALGLPAGALPVSPRAAFLECVEAAARLRPIAEAAARWRDRTTLGFYDVRCDPGTAGEALQELMAAVDAARAAPAGEEGA